MTFLQTCDERLQVGFCSWQQVVPAKLQPCTAGGQCREGAVGPSVGSLLPRAQETKLLSGAGKGNGQAADGASEVYDTGLLKMCCFF